MKVIHPGTLPDEDILSKRYQCHRCACVFQLEPDDLKDPVQPDPNHLQHLSDPRRYQPCPTCGHEVWIFDKKSWFTGFPTQEAPKLVEIGVTEYERCMRDNDDQRAQLDCIGLEGTPKGKGVSRGLNKSTENKYIHYDAMVMQMSPEELRHRLAGFVGSGSSFNAGDEVQDELYRQLETEDAQSPWDRIIKARSRHRIGDQVLGLSHEEIQLYHDWYNDTQNGKTERANKIYGRMLQLAAQTEATIQDSPKKWPPGWSQTAKGKDGECPKGDYLIGTDGFCYHRSDTALEGLADYYRS